MQREAGSLQGRNTWRWPAVLVVLLLIVSACANDSSESTAAPTTVSTTFAEVVGCDGNEIEAGNSTTCSVPGWSGRDFDIFVPDAYDPAEEWPVVIAYHGGGGNREAGARTSCPGGDLDDAGCLHVLGARGGFFTIYPDGTARRAGGRFRTWNAGGSGDLTCVVGAACDQAVDDIAYTAAMLDVLEEHYSIEPRVIVTGLSNGGAMAHRAGCDLSERVAVVVAFGGANQQPGCEPALPVSVLQVHGTEDPCWPYEGGALGGCLGGEALISGAVETVEVWAGAQNCGAPSEAILPDASDDGMTSEVTRWDGCDGGAVVELISVIGGGHTWPMGHSVAPRVVGPSTGDYSGSDLLWEFAQAVGS